MSHQPKHVYKFGPFRLDAAEHLLWRDETSVQLQPKVFDLLLVLVKHHGHLLEKDSLMKLVWPDTVVEEANLVNNISILRKVLGDNGQRFIETVPKLGYRFVASVQEIEVNSTELINQHQPAIEISKKTANSNGLSNAIRLMRNHQFLVGIILVAITSMVLFAAYLLMEGRKQTENYANKIQMSRLTSSGTAYEAAISPDGQLVGYILSTAVFSGYHSLWIKRLSTNQVTQLVPESGFRFRGLTFSPDGNFIYYSQRRGPETEYVLHRISIQGGLPQKILSGVDSAVSFSPDGNQIAFVHEDQASGESALMISGVDGGEANKIAVCKSPDSFSVDGPSWSPDGSLIAVAKLIPGPEFHFRLLAFKLNDKQEKPVGKTKWAWLMRVVWLKDGSGLVAAGRTKSSGTNDQIWVVNYPDGELRRITNDLSGYRNLNLALRDKTLVTVQSEVRSNLWVVDVENPDNARAITGDPVSQNGYKGVDWTPDGRIVYTSTANGSQNIWITNSDGSQSRQLTADSSDTDHFPSVSMDGSHIVFASSKSGPGRIWRIDMDGRNLTELSRGELDLKPNCSADGNWIVYSSESYGKRVIVKLPLFGGTAQEQVLTDKFSDFPVISPDNSLIACLYQEAASLPLRMALLPFAGGAPVRLLDLPNTHPWPNVRWRPDGRALSYLDPLDNSSNIWIFPLDGGARGKLTNFHAEQIFAYSWSRDGRYLVCARGTIYRDVVMISNFT